MCDRKTVSVVAAVICEGDRVFATQRGYGKWKDWWEFPGGKIEKGESPQQALIREIREELSADICVGELLQTVEYDYEEFHLSMQCFLCTIRSGKLELLEHEDSRWLEPDDFDSVHWLPADEMIIGALRSHLQQMGIR